MILLDCHTHTHNSPDAAADTVLSRCQRAAECGISVLSITDHCEVNRFFSLAHYGDTPNGYDTYDFGKDFELSMQENTAAKADCPEGVTLLCGIELGQAFMQLPLAEQIVADRRLDFVIGSAHQLPTHNDFAFLDYSKEDIHAVLHEYFETLYTLAQTDTYDVLAHLTYPLRYITAQGFTADMTRYRDLIAETMRAAIARGKGIEINTSGLRQAYGNTFPSLEYIKLYRDLGGEILTVGSDSHTNDDLGKGIPEALAMAQAAGFSSITYFRQRQPQFIIL